MSHYWPKPGLCVLILQLKDFFFFIVLLRIYFYLPCKQNQATLKSKLKCEEKYEDSTKDQGYKQNRNWLLHKVQLSNLNTRFESRVSKSGHNFSLLSLKELRLTKRSLFILGRLSRHRCYLAFQNQDLKWLPTSLTFPLPDNSCIKSKHTPTALFLYL